MEHTDKSNPKEKQTVSESSPPESGKRPSLNLHDLISETESLVTRHENAEQETETKVALLKDLIRKAESLKKTRIGRMKTIKKIANPFAANDLNDLFSAENRSMLVQLGLMTEGESTNFEKMNALIERLESIQYPTDEIKDKHELLLSARRDLQARIRADIESGKAEFEERRMRVREKTLKVLNKKSGRLGQTIKTLQDDSLVAEALERENFLKEVSAQILSLETRLKTSMENLARALEVESVDRGLMKTQELSGKERRMHVFNLRADVTGLVRTGDIKSPDEIVPWKTKSGTKYMALVRKLRDPETLRRLEETGEAVLLERLRRVLALNDALRAVYGRECDLATYEGGDKPFLREKSSFWKAFKNS